VTTVEKHMSNFWAFFQLNPMSDDVEYLLMKLFLAILSDVARRWYDSLLNKSINDMDQLKETFLNKWINKEDTSMLLNRLTKIKKSNKCNC